jgi:hypothetical protein
MLLELAAAAKAHGPPPAPPIADKDLLSLLLTAEGLLFAALAVSVTLQTIAPGTYLPPFINKGGLAFGIFLAVGAVAVGAGATWWQLYAKGFPQDFFAPLAASLAIAVAIVAQPIPSAPPRADSKGPSRAGQNHA